MLVIILMTSCNLSIGTVLTISTKPVLNEMGGEYSGQVYAFSNTLGNLSGVLGKRLVQPNHKVTAPYLGGVILDKGDIYRLETWIPLFYLIGASMLTGVVFMWIGNYGLLSWAKTEDEKEKLND